MSTFDSTIGDNGDYPSIAHHLLALARTQPHAASFEWFSDFNKTEIWSWQTLHQRACATAFAITQAVPMRTHVVLALPQNLNFIGAIFGCFYANCVAVPVYPPDSPKTLPRFLRIVENCNAALIITTSGIAAKIKTAIAEYSPTPALLCIDELASTSAFFPITLPQADQLALLQYTSGTTAAPKGVMLAHSNLMANERAIAQAYPQGEKPHCVSWLPFYHDMGLIGGLFFPVYRGMSATLFSTSTFLRRPSTWLQIISERRGTISPAPNFAYEYCARAIDENCIDTLDLSCWQSAICGAEAVRRDTVERFIARFSRAGFRASTFIPSYGLAESTVFVCADSRRAINASSAPNSAPLFSKAAQTDFAIDNEYACCGDTSASDIRIVDPNTHALLADSRIGEIWVKSASVAVGYWGHETLSDQIFNAQIATTGEAGFLRTGDLGFIRDACLYVTGRIKELVILRGRNYVPQDIETIVRDAIAAFEPGQCAAFAIEKNGSEALIVAIELQRRRLEKTPLSHIEADIRLALRGTLSVEADTIVTVRMNSLPRTSSGKLQRNTVKALYLNDELDRLIETALEIE